MTTNSAATRLRIQNKTPMSPVVDLALVILMIVASCSQVQAATVLGPWIPIFKGIDHAVGTNTPGSGGFPDLEVMHAVRVDLSDPDVRLFTTPRHTNYIAAYRETAGYKVPAFLTNNKLQVAINANDFHDPGTGNSPSYNMPAGSPFELTGLMISQGLLVSSQDSSYYSASITFDGNKVPNLIPTNYPQQSIAGISNAVTGTYAVLIDGVNVGSNYVNLPGSIHDIQPRTAVGFSKDKRYLFLMTIDGRQSGYSAGAYDWETGAWLTLVGASDGINMDGGGSTTMVMADTTGKAVDLNHSSSLAAYGYDRTVGAHLGVFAKPLPGVINDVAANPDDTAATITWTTINPATTMVQYGLTTNFDFSTPLLSAMVTNHAVVLTNLMPNTDYYYRAVSSIAANQYSSSNFLFTTSNYVTTNTVFAETNTWKITTANLDGTQWTGKAYDDSSWMGPFPGILWSDVRGANPDMQLLNTELPADPDNFGYPYVTYYFRTHFAFTNSPVGVSLAFNAQVDDGAVFYLNGAEIYRLRMDPSAPVQNSTVATGYPCDGDATCLDSFLISGSVMTNLVVGDNVLAVEVHNLDPASPDVTFGVSVDCTIPFSRGPELAIVSSDKTSTLSWERGGFRLMESSALEGPWTAVAGSYVVSPYTITNSSSIRFYRLQK